MEREQGGKSEKFEESACFVGCGLRGSKDDVFGRGGIE